MDQTDDRKLSCGHIPGVFSTVDFGVSDTKSIDDNFALQQKYAEGGNGTCPKIKFIGPKATSEYWSTDGVRWGFNNPPTINVNQVIMDMQYMHSVGASFNMWLVHAGTNFGWIPGGHNLGDHDGQVEYVFF